MNTQRNKTHKTIYSIFILLVMLGGTFLLYKKANGTDLPDDYPRLANAYFSPSLTLEEARSLAKWDALILGIEVQHNSPEALEEMRRINPDIIILAYISSQEIGDSFYQITDTTHPNYQLISGIKDEWWLRDSAGDQITFWPGSKMINVTPVNTLVNNERWYTYLPNFMHNHVMSTGYWDGIYYDNMWNDVAWLNNGDIDLNDDGIAESSEILDNAWREGMNEMMSLSRELEGDNAIIIGNSGGQYFTHINGRFIEEFPAVTYGGWSGAMQTYYDAIQSSFSPPVVIVNGVSSTGTASDYQHLRYTLASTLLNNGFASFDYGPLRHADLWWYDEYNSNLGEPLSSAVNLSDVSSTNIKEGVWRRDYTNGIVVVNATDGGQNIDLGSDYEKITGTQDDSVNNGEVISSIYLAPRDGIILLKRQIEINNAEYINGVQSHAYTATGQSLRYDFFTYNSTFANDLHIIEKDLDNNGCIETVVGWNNKVQIYDSQGFLSKEFYPYSTSYNSGINLAVGDIEGNGKMEIVTGTGFGGGPHVRIFDYQGNLKHPGWFAYAEHFRGGVNVELGDVDGDGRDEIITGAGHTGGPHVRIFNGSGEFINHFFAYDQYFRGGVDVATADLNNDGRDEIITGAGPGGGPHVRILNQRGEMVFPGFFAFDQNYRGGLKVTAADIDDDNQVDIVVSKL
ncbi:VCBS repeat-containing protein [Patescibacteria group bacterium]|nr:VCBS repeat-containing protein [Patescibacteria group bacterium]MBU1891112.1 VCBS repeat-containing protein [Patescibacteria group bacterium]